MIRAFLLFSLLLTLVYMGCPVARAADDPGDQFLAAYLVVQEGDTAEMRGDWAAAQAKYNAALTILNEIKIQNPEWHPNLLEFRSKYCTEHLAALESKVPAGTPGTAAAITTKPIEIPAAAPMAEAPAPLSESDQVKQLQSALQKSRDEVRILAETRDQLKSQLDIFLREPAPTERAKSKEILAQLHALQAANETAKAQLAAAEAKAGRADELSSQLEQTQKKVKELEATREQLNGKLQEALAKVDTGKSSAQIEELVKKNTDLTGQLATAQSEITKLRDQVLASSKLAQVAQSAETIQLRAHVTQMQMELDDTKSLLGKRTEELKLSQAQLEKLRTENMTLTTSHDELLAKLAESDRQLRAAKASGEKNDQIIQQLHKENDLLRKMAEQKDAKSAVQAQPQEESGGFLWFKHKAKPAPAPTTPAATNAVATAQSEDGKLTATVTAPPPSGAAKAAADEERAVADAATESAGSSTEVRMLLAQAHASAMAKDFAAAKSYLTTAESKEPNNLSVLTNLANTLYQLNQLDEGIDVLHKAIAIEPNQTRSRSLLGVLFLRKGRIEDAYNELTRAVAIDPRNAEAHNYLGIVMSTKGWATAGEQEIRRAIELNPDYADAQFNLAVIYAREKTPRMELARYHYQKAISLGSAHDQQLESLLKESEPVPTTTKVTQKEGLP